MHETDYVPPPRSQSSSLIIVLVVAVVSFALIGLFVLRAREEARRQQVNNSLKQMGSWMSATPANVATDLALQMDELLARVDRPDVPGCAVAIVRHGELIYCKGFGSADLEHQVLNTPRTVFETASFSKSFTCVCVALLMDEGKTAPEDDLRKFVPEMHAFDPPIRIRDLIRCESGLWDQVSLPILVGWDNAPQQHPYTRQDFFDLITGQKRLPFKPGTEFRYSSGDYFLLGIIVERVSGLPLARFARERVFEPLGMTRTHFEEDPTRIIPQRAVGHYKPDGDEWHLWRPTAHWAGGGGLKTCVEDLVRWDGNFSDNKLPSGRYLDELLHDGTLLGNRFCLDVDANLKAADPEAARESPVGQYRGLKRLQFTGGAWGLTTAMSRFPDQELTAICLSNSDEITAWNINRQIADLLLADELQPMPERPATKPLSEQPTATIAEAEQRDKIGAYRMRRSGQIWQISWRDGGLQATDHLLKTHRLRPLSPTRFDPEGPFYASTQFVFPPSADDAPYTFTSQWDEPENRGRLEFERVELVEPTIEQLNQYAGIYVSDELDATYRLAMRDDHLWLRVNSRRWEQLDATVRDEFVPHRREPADGRILTFLRGDRGEVTGLSMEYYRVKGIEFAKQ